MTELSIPTKLKPREMKFISAYHEHFDVEKAAVDAGYSKKSAYFKGSHLRRKFRNEIQAYAEEHFAKSGIAAGRVIQEISLIAFHNPKDFVDGRDELLTLEKLGEKARAIKSVKHRTLVGGGEIKEFIFYDKQTALDQLAKMAGLYKDEVTAPQQVTFIIEGGATAPIQVNLDTEAG